nr:unnamed protein product [Digitaria exilis]
MCGTAGTLGPAGTVGAPRRVVFEGAAHHECPPGLPGWCWSWVDGHDMYAGLASPRPPLGLGGNKTACRGAEHPGLRRRRGHGGSFASST